jgi:HSP20 family molecular chaperone IbpA
MSDKAELVKSDTEIIEQNRRIPIVSPLVDIYENDDEILLHADMPGVEKDNIKVNIDNGTLTLSAVRNLGAKRIATWEEFGALEYKRSFSVPQTIDVSKIDAELKNGVLRLHLPKSEAAKPRQIAIKSG